MKISVVGTGYVGLVASLCFADAGHSVTCTDSDQNKMKLLRDGQLPFFEPGLADIFLRKGKSLNLVDSVEDVTEASDLIFLAIGTPELPDGSADLDAIFRVTEHICKSAKGSKTIALKSTVPVGTAHRLRAFCKEHTSHNIEIVNNPEFLKQGSAVEDFIHPDRIVIGTLNPQTQKLMRQVYEPFLSETNPILFMDNTSAEMTKYAANSFLAMKVSFINELALLSDLVGADIESIKEGFTSDSRINPSFFHPGIGYGGSCFPKDVRALVHTAKDHKLDLKLFKAVDEVNERQKTILSQRILARFEDLSQKHIAIWGLSFKPNTDDVRRAPSIQLIEDLVQKGAKVSAFDPIATDKAVSACKVEFTVCPSAIECVENADALVIVTEWSEFKTPSLEQIKSKMKSPVVFDGRNIFDPAKMSELGFEYYGIGRQVRAEKA